MEDIVLELEAEPKLKHLRVFAGAAEEIDVVEPFGLGTCNQCQGQGGSGIGCGDSQTCQNGQTC